MTKSQQHNKEYYSNYETCRNYPPFVENDIEMYEEQDDTEED